MWSIDRPPCRLVPSNLGLNYCHRPSVGTVALCVYRRRGSALGIHITPPSSIVCSPAQRLGENQSIMPGPSELVYTWWNVSASRSSFFFSFFLFFFSFAASRFWFSLPAHRVYCAAHAVREWGCECSSVLPSHGYFVRRRFFFFLLSSFSLLPRYRGPGSTVLSLENGILQVLRTIMVRDRPLARLHLRFLGRGLTTGAGLLYCTSTLNSSLPTG